MISLTVRYNWTRVQLNRTERILVYGVGWVISYEDCIDWCCEHFGEERIYIPGRIETGRWLYNDHGVFEFQQEEDAVLFALRWA